MNFSDTENPHAGKKETWMDSIFRTLRKAFHFSPRILPEAKFVPPDIADAVAEVFFEAEKLASTRKNRRIETEHFLIALCARDAFKSLELDADAVIQKTFHAVVPNAPLNDFPSLVAPPLSPGALHAVALAMKESEARGKPEFDCNDLLIALIREQDGTAAKALASFGITEEVARAKLAGKP